MDCRREVAIMHHLKGHPNIVVLRSAFEDKHHVHLVLDLCAGGEVRGDASPVNCV